MTQDLSYLYTHEHDENGKVRRANPYRRIQRMGYPDLIIIVKTGRMICEDGVTPYPEDKLPEEYKKKETKVTVSTTTEVPVVEKKKAGRPPKKVVIPNEEIVT